MGGAASKTDRFSKGSDHGSLMSDHEIAELTASLEELLKGCDVFSTTFYDDLFEKHPDLRKLFSSDNMLRQGRLVVYTIRTAIRKLKEPHEFREVVHELGLRHGGYGVKPETYAPQRESLVVGLKTVLKAKLTPSCEAAWVKLHILMSEVMIQATMEFENTVEMSDPELHALSSSLAEVEGRSAEFREAFYARITSLMDVHALFPHTDMHRHATLMLSSLKQASIHGGNAQTMASGLGELGLRHCHYGVKAEHFPLMTEAVMLAMEDVLKEKCTDEVRVAWAEAMKLLSTLTQDHPDFKAYQGTVLPHGDVPPLPMTCPVASTLSPRAGSVPAPVTASSSGVSACPFASKLSPRPAAAAATATATHAEISAISTPSVTTPSATTPPATCPFAAKLSPRVQPAAQLAVQQGTRAEKDLTEIIRENSA